MVARMLFVVIGGLTTSYQVRRRSHAIIRVSELGNTNRLDVNVTTLIDLGTADHYYPDCAESASRR
jgi:hypothetical protein